MTPHLNNGRVLLQNTTDEEWYYLGIDSFEGVLTMSPSQEELPDITGDDFSPYVVIIGSDGNYYKLSLITESETVTYSLELLTTPEPPIKLLLRDPTTLTFYEVAVTINGEDSLPYLQIINLDTLTRVTITRHWRTISEATLLEPTNIIVYAS